jgi:GntR family transcriptional regulator / MocR family aminotransferase
VNRANPGADGRSVPPGSDFLQLDVAEAPRGGRTDWLTEQLRGAIADGRLPVGSRLPASRVLAAELHVSRGVVTEAYRRLADDGHVAGHGRGGTRVVTAPSRAVPAAPAPSSPGELFPARPGPDVFDRVRTAPARIDLSPGVPDLAAFPRSGWLRAERAVLAGLAAAGLGYSDPTGEPSVRAAIAGWLSRNRGVPADPAEVIVVAGAAQGLGLLAQVLRERGVRRIAVEDPGSLGMRQHLANWRLDTPPVPVDELGMRVDRLRGTGAEVALLTPAHQFPTGVVLAPERRRELLDWADAGGLVIEDDYDAEHRYDRPPTPALRAERPGRTVYLGSVSKWLAPALRVGWMLAPSWLHAELVAAKRFADLGNPVLTQLVLAELMESGEMERQLRFARARHRRRRDAMITAIARHLPGATVHGVAAGLHLLVTFPDGPPDTVVARRALRDGVKVQPLSWHRVLDGPPGLVLGYAARTVTEIADAVAVLGRTAR